MKTQHKIYIAIVLLAALGGGLFWAWSTAKAERQLHGASSATPDVVAINLPSDDVDKITKVELSVPNKEKDKPATAVTLEKKDADWMITAPITAKASNDDVKNLIGKLKDLKVKEAAEAGVKVEPAGATHIVAYKGVDKTIDFYFGKSGKRG